MVVVRAYRLARNGLERPRHDLATTAAPGRRLHFPEVGTIPKPRPTREFPEFGLIVSQQKALTNNHFTTGKNAAVPVLNGP